MALTHGGLAGISNADWAQIFQKTAKPPSPNDPLNDPGKRKGMIAWRLRIAEGELLPFEFIETHLSGDKVYVFIFLGKEPVVLTDEADLFPSDQLIGSLRLIRKG